MFKRPLHDIGQSFDKRGPTQKKVRTCAYIQGDIVYVLCILPVSAQKVKCAK